MITSIKVYNDLTVIREIIIRCGSDWRDYPQGEEIHTVCVERRLIDHIEVILPTDPIFAEAANATREVSANMIGKNGGMKKTKSKQIAAQKNGKHGGRPKVVKKELDNPGN